MQTTTIGKYTIVEKIGAGAMGDVFKAHDSVLSRDVAIKTISAELGADDELRKRFEREAQSAARLNHPNIITVYDFGEEHDKLYMAMELLDGNDLKQVILSGTATTVDQKIGIMAQICEGLAFAHSHQIVHRDLKPANIHVLSNGQVKIMDFGLARLAGSEMTRTGMVMGTPNYMSPEQVRGEKADARSDIFALGCVFYELLTNHKAFEAPSMHAVLFKVMSEEPPPLLEVLPDVPVAVAQIVEKALAKDPAKRFQNGGEMLGPVEEARQAVADGNGDEPLPDLPPAREARPDAARVSTPGDQVSAPVRKPQSGARPRPTVPSPPAPEPPPPSRTPILLAGGLLALVALIGVGVVVFRPSGTAAPPQTRPAQVDGLTRAVVDTQLELARKKLLSGETADAAQQAERALKLDPESADAKQVLAEAKKVLAAIARAEEDAKTAASGDAAKGPEAFFALVQLAPTSPVAVQLAPKLEPAMKDLAKDAQKLMTEARLAALKAGVDKTPRFLDGEAKAREAQDALKRGAFATASCRFMGARDRYRQAARDNR